MAYHRADGDQGRKHIAVLAGRGVNHFAPASALVQGRAVARRQAEDASGGHGASRFFAGMVAPAPIEVLTLAVVRFDPFEGPIRRHAVTARDPKAQGGKLSVGMVIYPSKPGTGRIGSKDC